MVDFFRYSNTHFILFVLGIGLLILIFTVSKINKRDRRILVSIILTTLALALFEFLETEYDGNHYDYENFPRYLFSVLSYIIRPIIIVLFFYMRLDFKSKKSYFLWSGVVINAIVYVLVLFAYKNPSMRWVVWYYEDNVFDRTWLGYTIYAICGIYLVILMIASIVNTAIHKTRKQIDVIIIFTASMAIFAQIIGIIFNFDYTNTSEAFILGAALYFIYLNYDISANEAVAHEREMQAKTTALMLSQIQPHFIYNTLATIQILCETDPQTASKLIEDFTQYLRMNTDALSKNEPVPVTQEIAHATAYSKIEMVRFANVSVKFDVRDTDFKLPVLTIEPIVENAIKYGARAKEKGVVEIITYKEDNKHILIIKDNGPGFDPNKIDTIKNHVGIENVKKRVINMVRGTFDIISEIGSGTIVIITIPEN